MAGKPQRSAFRVQNLANTAWAYANVKVSEKELFTALARAAEQRTPISERAPIKLRGCSLKEWIPGK